MNVSTYSDCNEYDYSTEISNVFKEFYRNSYDSWYHFDGHLNLCSNLNPIPFIHQCGHLNKTDKIIETGNCFTLTYWYCDVYINIYKDIQIGSNNPKVYMDIFEANYFWYNCCTYHITFELGNSSNNTDETYYICLDGSLCCINEPYVTPTNYMIDYVFPGNQ